MCFFFFQAEDGIRDDLVTGVQTCALPISEKAAYFKTVESQRTKWEKGILGRLEDYFKDEHKTIAAAISRGSEEDAASNVEHALLVLEQQGTLKNLIVSVYQDVGEDFGACVFIELKYGEKQIGRASCRERV